MSGRRISAAIKGDAKPMYLKFWATWCAACIAEMPHFVDAHERFGANIEFVAINVAINDSPERIERARSEYNLEMPIVFDQSGELWSKFDIFGTPTHVVIDASGEITYIGHAAGEALDQALESAYSGTPTADKAPDFSIETLDGEVFSLSKELAGAGTVSIFFFSPWCESYVKDSYPDMARECVEARQNIAELHEMLGDRVRFVGIGSRYSARAESTQFYRDKHDIKFPLAFDATDQVFRAYKVRHFPTIIIVGRNGVIRHRVEGSNIGLAAFDST